MGINEVLVVNSLEQIKALSSPYRIKIIETFDNKPASAKDISLRVWANRMAESTTISKP